MKNINILSLEDNSAHFWGFRSLCGRFTYHFTLSGLVLRAASDYDEDACKIEGGLCTDEGFVQSLAEHGFTYGTFLQFDQAYIGLVHQDLRFTLGELVAEYYQRA